MSDRPPDPGIDYLKALAIDGPEYRRLREDAWPHERIVGELSPAEVGRRYIRGPLPPFSTAPGVLDNAQR